MLSFCIAMLCDWLIMPISYPIRSKIKTNHDLPTCASCAWKWLHVFALRSDWILGLSVFVVIGFGFRHSSELKTILGNNHSFNQSRTKCSIGGIKVFLFTFLIINSNNNYNNDIHLWFKISWKCQSKIDCLIYEEC